MYLSMTDDDFPATKVKEKLISFFTEITSSSREEAKSFLETHQWDLDAAVSTYTENNASPAESNFFNPSDQELLRIIDARIRSSNLRIDIPHSPSDDSSDYIPSEWAPSPSRLRSRSPSPPSRARYPLLSKGQRAGNTRTSGHISGGTDIDSDEAQEYLGGGEQSGMMMVQDPKKDEDDDASFDKDKESDVESPRTSFRIVSAEPQVIITHVLIIWRNGFTVNASRLKTLDNPEDATFIEDIQRLECPRELNPHDSKTRVCVKIITRPDEDFPESPKPFTPFQGVGRTLAGSPSVSAEQPISSDSPPTSMSLVVDPAAPTTSIQLRLADGTRMISQFNTHHTVRDIRGFIDESRPGGCKDYQLLFMGFPPKPLPDLDQTIENAGISNSLLIQKC